MEEAIKNLRLEKNEIFNRWETAVREKVPASKQTGRLALRDHLPELLDDILDIMSQHGNSTALNEEEVYSEIVKNSAEHGRHRASTSFYTIDQILQEYMIFHRILNEFLRSRSLLTPKVNSILNFSLEYSMLISSKAFSDSLQEMRQKLIGILAHDMRNPISAALFAVDVMKLAEGKDRLEKLRLMAYRSLKRSLDLIEGLLDSVTVGAGEGMTLDFEETNIVDTITAVHEEASEVYAHKMELQSPEEEINGVYDATMVRRMLENLISNAVKYGAREKPVTLKVENSEDMVVLSVHNWGNPITEENQKQIFHFLRSTHSNGVRELKSWGMGLTLARAVAEAHGGKLELISNEMDGTTFSVSLDKHKNSPGKRRAALNFR